MKQESGRHAFDGACRPHSSATSHETFSLGVFEWVEKKHGGLKRGPVKVRVSGRCVDLELVEAKAAEIAAELDAGTYTGPKTVRVR